jgi:IS30 family transposase
MKRRRRIYFTESQKAEIWDRWQRGESMSFIGRSFERDSSSIHPVITRTGGFRPEPRKRRPLTLSLAQREEISRGLGAGRSYRWIAKHLGRAPSTISREVARNGGRKTYRATKADAAAWARASRPKPCKLACNKALCRTVSNKLRQQWSPQQIAGWLKKRYPDDEARRVSHETIYRSLFVQARGALKKELIAYLRVPRSMRRPRASSLRRSGLGQIRDMVSIRERPAAVEDRAVPGHWEGDLIAGSKGSHIVTLVERHTRYLMLAKVDSRDTETVIAALIKHSKKLPGELYKSLTWDRGKELSDHKRFTLATDIQVYFCDPKSPWQRGSNENTNRLLRQYFPKGTDLSVHSQAKLNAVARQMNERPRKTLDYDTPAERLQDCVAMTG